VLLDKLIVKQQELGASDRRFAGLLGVPRSTWQLTRTGKVPLGARIARAAQRAFPDLAAEAALFLVFGASGGADSASALAIA